jgi:hypothetical protein
VLEHKRKIDTGLINTGCDRTEILNYCSNATTAHLSKSLGAFEEGKLKHLAASSTNSNAPANQHKQKNYSRAYFEYSALLKRVKAVKTSVPRKFKVRGHSSYSNKFLILVVAISLSFSTIVMVTKLFSIWTGWGSEEEGTTEEAQMFSRNIDYYTDSEAEDDDGQHTGYSTSDAEGDDDCHFNLKIKAPDELNILGNVSDCRSGRDTYTESRRRKTWED